MASKPRILSTDSIDAISPQLDYGNYSRAPIEYSRLDHPVKTRKGLKRDI